MPFTVLICGILFTTFLPLTLHGPARATSYLAWFDLVLEKEQRVVLPLLSVNLLLSVFLPTPILTIAKGSNASEFFLTFSVLRLRILLSKPLNSLLQKFIINAMVRYVRPLKVRVSLFFYRTIFLNSSFFNSLLQMLVFNHYCLFMHPLQLCCLVVFDCRMIQQSSDWINQDQHWPILCSSLHLIVSNFSKQQIPKIKANSTYLCILGHRWSVLRTV